MIRRDDGNFCLSYFMTTYLDVVTTRCKGVMVNELYSSITVTFMAVRVGSNHSGLRGAVTVSFSNLENGTRPY